MASKTRTKDRYFETIPLADVRAVLRRQRHPAEKIVEKRDPYAIRVEAQPPSPAVGSVYAREERRRG